MPFWQNLLRRRQPVDVFTPNVTHFGDTEDAAGALLAWANGMTPVQLWAEQPYLRTVVSFVARNIAQLGVHVFERVGETDRRRDRDNPAARALAFTDGSMTTYDLVFALVGDLLLFDRAYWLVLERPDVSSGWSIRRIPPNWVAPKWSDPFTVTSYRLTLKTAATTVPASQVLAFTTYSPAKTGSGSSMVESLKSTLWEQVQASEYRRQIWARGGRVSSVLERPANAPQWSDAAREQFREDWYAKYTGHGPKAGGTPILEDGMKISRIDFNAQEQQFVEASKLSLATVASGFHVNPTMVGQLDAANYSNVMAFRKMLYGDTLGPYIAQIEQRINTFLLPMLGMDPSRFYVEFNIAEKLQGDFAEQTTALQSAVGRPWMTADEARARLNLPSIGGNAEELVTPLNVLIGGQSSATDSGSQNRRAGEIRVKARNDVWADKATDVIRGFFARQEQTVRSTMGAKAADWWNQDRWDKELSDKLFKLAAAISGDIGPETAKSLGFDASDYSTDRTLKFLRAVADDRALHINEATRVQLEDALKADDPGAAADSVWDVAKDQRSGAAGTAVTTFVAAFAAHEAGDQLLGNKGQKTWVTGANPRPDHAAMDGETVKLNHSFSNGMKWPGDSTDPDETAGCNCSVTISRS
jgi:HK97 family phage portal protein